MLLYDNSLTFFLAAEKSRYNGNIKQDYNSGSCTEEFEIPLFDLSTITKATDNFSVNRKIGEGGFGPVYKVNALVSWAILYKKYTSL